MHTPLNVRVDNLGRVVDWRDAVPFHPVTGVDQAYPSRLEHHTEAGNVFSAGTYDAMDVTFYNYTIIGGDMGCYWKVSAPFHALRWYPTMSVPALSCGAVRRPIDVA